MQHVRSLDGWVTIGRDFTVRLKAKQAGWRLVVVWECALRKPGNAKRIAKRLARWLQSDAQQLEIDAT